MIGRPDDRMVQVRTDEVAAGLSADAAVTDAGRRVWQQRFRTAVFAERRAALDQILREQGASTARQ